MYDNQKQIEEIQQQLLQVSPDIKIGAVTLKENRATAIEVMIPFNGNSGIIKKLQELGWKKTWREREIMAEGVSENYVTTRYKGYKMYQRMQLGVPTK